MTTKTEPMDYWLLNRCDLMLVQTKNKHIYRVEECVSAIQYYITNSVIFHVIHEGLLPIAHGRRDIMLKELLTIYKNVTRIVMKPIDFSDCNSCCRS